MNSDQVASLIRLLFAAGGPLGAWLISQKMITADQLGTLTSVIIGLIAIVPPIVSGIIGQLAHTDSAKIASVAAIPEVKSIVVKATASPASAASIASVDPAQPKVTKAP